MEKMKTKEIRVTPLLIASALCIVAFFLNYMSYNIDFSSSTTSVTASGFDLLLGKMHGLENVKRGGGSELINDFYSFYIPIFLIKLVILLPLLSGFIFYNLAKGVKNEALIVNKISFNHVKYILLSLGVLQFFAAIYTTSTDENFSIGFGVWLILFATSFVALGSKYFPSFAEQRINLNSTSDSQNENPITKYVNYKTALVACGVGVLAVFLPWYEFTASAKAMGMKSSASSSISGISIGIGQLSTLMFGITAYLISQSNKFAFVTSIVLVIISVGLLFDWFLPDLPQFNMNLKASYGGPSAGLKSAVSNQIGIYLLQLSSILLAVHTWIEYKSKFIK